VTSAAARWLCDTRCRRLRSRRSGAGVIQSSLLVRRTRSLPPVAWASALDHVPGRHSPAIAFRWSPSDHPQLAIRGADCEGCVVTGPVTHHVGALGRGTSPIRRTRPGRRCCCQLVSARPNSSARGSRSFPPSTRAIRVAGLQLAHPAARPFRVSGRRRYDQLHVAFFLPARVYASRGTIDERARVAPSGPWPYRGQGSAWQLGR